MSRIVELHDRSPLVIKKAEIQGDATYVCRCGLSMQWPLCDGTHKQTASEPKDAIVLYMRDAQGTIHRRNVGVLKAGEANPRKGEETKVPTPGTEAQAAEAAGSEEPA